VFGLTEPVSSILFVVFTVGLLCQQTHRLSLVVRREPELPCWSARSEL
jgi:hypothetical protein